MKETVVLLPLPGAGHLPPMVEVAKHFLQNDFSVTVLLLNSPSLTSSRATLISRVTSTNPSIAFHRLPAVSLPPQGNPSLIFFDLLRLSNPHVLSFLTSLSKTTIIRALVLDFLCTDALDVATELHLPSYFLFATSASNLAAFLLIPSIESQNSTSFKDLGKTLIHFPGDILTPIPASDMLCPLQDRNSVMYDVFLYHLKRLPLADGIMVNSFESLERKAVEALVNGLCFSPTPPIYCIGPVIAKGEGEEGERHECLTWLDQQPPKSVVFLCFGSMGSFSEVQLKEMAAGLERSGWRFLWVVRGPPDSDPAKRFLPMPEPDLDVLMPEGFLERIEGRGMVMKSWAPQTAILQHESVGGFVSHCGWNSVLEAVCAGVPIIAWPLFAEQMMNKVFLVEEAKLAVEIRGYDEELVTAEEVESKIKWLMELEGGKELRDRAKVAKESAVVTLREGGLSHKALMELVKAVKAGGGGRKI